MRTQVTATPRYAPEPDRPFQHAEPYPEFPGDLTPENTRKVLRAVALQRVVEIALGDPDVLYVRDTTRQNLERLYDDGTLNPTDHDVLGVALDELIETAAEAIGRLWLAEGRKLGGILAEF